MFITINGLADAISDIRKVQEEIYDDRWNLRKRFGVTMSLEMQNVARMIREVRDDWTENAYERAREIREGRLI